ncbi:uncharacterized protein LOC123559644 [Mercenaria mercenaria]|uniref:uncharacterized protein LOC123559644 n=1 Tax=Mercenaria mercenaria TaxID=6596 RepID=UPI00234F42C7|nr:uncharacterized protein LOC123559644 [Mercenaria mercenaria]
MDAALIHFCHPCSRQRKYQIATYYCMSCGKTGAYICWQCKRQHEKFEELGKHVIQTISDNCSNGQNQCSCTDFQGNEGQSKGRTKFCIFQEVQNLIDIYEKCKANLSTIEGKRQADIDKLKQDKNRITNNIREIRANINIQLDRLQRESLRELDIRFQRSEDRITNEVKYINEVSHKWENKMKEVEMFRGRDVAVFQKVVHEGKLLKDKSDALWEHERNGVRSDRLDFIPNQDITNGKFDLKSFGNFVDDRIHDYNTSLQDEHDISIETDDLELDCDITGCCVMSDGSVILADHTNANLKKLNITYKVLSSCNLPEPPCDVCVINDTEVAVTLPKKKTVQFVMVADQLKLGKSLYVGYGCMCTEYSLSSQTLFVTYDWPMQICVFSKDGDFLHTIWGKKEKSSEQKKPGQNERTDSNTDTTKQLNVRTNSSKSMLSCISNKSKKSKGEKQGIFHTLEDIMFSSTDQRLYVCDLEKGLLVLSPDGHVISTIRNFREMPEFAPKRICRGYNDDFFVYGQSEKTKHFAILYIGKDKKVEKIKGEVLRRQDFGEIEAMCFNRLTSQLIVTTKTDSSIKVFNVL